MRSIIGGRTESVLFELTARRLRPCRGGTFADGICGRHPYRRREFGDSLPSQSNAVLSWRKRPALPPGTDKLPCFDNPKSSTFTAQPSGLILIFAGFRSP